MPSTGAGTLANDLLSSLNQGKKFDLPDVDLDDGQFQIPDGKSSLYNSVELLSNDDLTTRKIDGDGTFDAMMQALNLHMKKEYEANRITGQEYAKTYISLVGSALQTGVQFLLGKDQAYWQAVMAQQQAQRAEIETITARIGLETAKAQLAIARTQTLTAEAEYALTKLKLATEDAQYGLVLAQTEQSKRQTSLIDEQIKQTQAQTTNIGANTTQTTYTTERLLPQQEQGLALDNAAKTFTNEEILYRQRDLLQEQIEVQRALTQDYTSGGNLVAVQLGKQKALWDQQITSYKRDAEVKAAKIFTDAWITQKTIDEGLLAPNNFKNDIVDAVLASIKNKNELG